MNRIKGILIKKRRNYIMKVKEKNIFDIIRDHSINDGLDEIMLQNEEYIQIQKKISKQADQLDRQDFTKEQHLLIDRLVSAHTESGAFYGKMTYKQGFRDCASLLWEMNLIRAS